MCKIYYSITNLTVQSSWPEPVLACEAPTTEQFNVEVEAVKVFLQRSENFTKQRNVELVAVKRAHSIRQTSTSLAHLSPTLLPPFSSSSLSQLCHVLSCVESTWYENTNNFQRSTTYPSIAPSSSSTLWAMWTLILMWIKLRSYK